MDNLVLKSSVNGCQQRLERSAAAAYLGLRPRTLAIWASRTYRRKKDGKTPVPFYKVGSRVFYLLSDLDDYLERCRVF